jgi:predicted PurR-regulated permease PerM
MNPIDTAESALQKFIFDFLDRFGVSLTIVAVLLALVWKVVPEAAKIIPKLAEVVIDNYRAQTEYIREGQKALASLPSIFSEMKTAIIAELQKGHSQIRESIGADTDRRIEDKVDKLTRKVSYSEPDSDPPPAVVSHRPSRTG